MSGSSLPPPIGDVNLYVVQEPTPIKQNCTIQDASTTIDELIKTSELIAPQGALLGRTTARKRLFGASDAAIASVEKRARVVDEQHQVAEPYLACLECGLLVPMAQRREHTLSHARIYSCGWKRCKYSWPVRAEIVAHMRSAHSVDDPRQVREMNAVERAAELARVAARCFPGASLEQVAPPPGIEKVEAQQPAQKEDEHVSVVGNVPADHARELQVLKEEKTPAQLSDAEWNARGAAQSAAWRARGAWNRHAGVKKIVTRLTHARATTVHCNMRSCEAVLKLAELPGHCHQRLERHAATHFTLYAFGCNECGWQTQFSNRLRIHIAKHHHGSMATSFVDRRKGRSEATMNDMVMRCFATEEEKELVGWKEEEEKETE